MQHNFTRNQFAAAATTILVCFLTLHCKKSSESKEIFKDDFNRGSFGSNWVIGLPGGTSFGISSGAAYPVSSGTTFSAMPTAMYQTKVTGGFKLSAKFSISGGQYKSLAYLIGRSTGTDSAANSYACGYYYDSTADATFFAFGRAASSTLSNIGNVAMHTLNSGISDTIALTFDGTSIKCEISGNSTIAISVKDSTYGDGYIGLLGGGNNSNYIYFDDFSAEKL